MIYNAQNYLGFYLRHVVLSGLYNPGRWTKRRNTVILAMAIWWLQTDWLGSGGRFMSWIANWIQMEKQHSGENVMKFDVYISCSCLMLSPGWLWVIGFGDEPLYRPVVMLGHFGGSRCFHIQVREIGQRSKQQERANKISSCFTVHFPCLFNTVSTLMMEVARTCETFAKLSCTSYSHLPCYRTPHKSPLESINQVNIHYVCGKNYCRLYQKYISV
jgi:hypothetical protein